MFKTIEERNRQIAEVFCSIPREKRTGKHWHKDIEDLVEREVGVRLKTDTIRDIVNSLEDEGFIEHRVVEPSCALLPERLGLAEERLFAMYRLRHGVVGDLSRWFRLRRLRNGQPPDESLVRDDELHRQLSSMGLRVLGPILRPNDRLGVASGRGPGIAATMLAEQAERAQSYPELDQIVALCGDMAVRGRGKNLEGEKYDANEVALRLHKALPQRPPHRMVTDTLIRSKRVGRRLGFAWADHSPNVALVGVGALAGNHRLLNHRDIKELEPLHNDITSLIDFAKRYDAEFNNKKSPVQYHCVGDVCNYLFAVPPPGGTIDDLPQSFLDLIDSLNARIASTPISNLKGVSERGSVLAITGGLEHKAYAIRHILLQNGDSQDAGEDTQPQCITHLVTDDSVADWLVRNRKIKRHPKITKARQLSVKKRPRCK